LADLELVSMLELRSSFPDSRKVSTSWASATTGLEGGLTSASDMFARLPGFCSGESTIGSGKCECGAVPKRTNRDLGQSLFISR
jgi:hypothetical protein